MERYVGKHQKESGRRTRDTASPVDYVRSPEVCARLSKENVELRSQVSALSARQSLAAAMPSPSASESGSLRELAERGINRRTVGVALAGVAAGVVGAAVLTDRGTRPAAASAVTSTAAEKSAHIELTAVERDCVGHADRHARRCPKHHRQRRARQRLPRHAWRSPHFGQPHRERGRPADHVHDQAGQRTPPTRSRGRVSTSSARPVHPCSRPPLGAPTSLASSTTTRSARGSASARRGVLDSNGHLHS